MKVEEVFPIDQLVPGLPAVPRWVELPADATAKTKMKFAAGNSFATDWAVRLPRPFRFNSVDYRWSSVDALNQPHFGSGNTPAFGLKFTEWDVTLPGTDWSSQRRSS